VPNILRKRAAARRIGIGLTKFSTDFVLVDVNDPYVAHTDEQVSRVRPVELGERSIGFFSDELDVLIESLRQWRDGRPLQRKEPEQLRVGRDAWRRGVSNKLGETEPA
jgi:hypothetical protein